jgi:hypothetical protein
MFGASDAVTAREDRPDRNFKRSSYCSGFRALAKRATASDSISLGEGGWLGLARRLLIELWKYLETISVPGRD